MASILQMVDNSNIQNNPIRRALYPIELVNGIASMSNYPSAKILQDFVKDMI